MKNLVLVVVVMSWTLTVAVKAHGQMSSANYAITASVVSGGGGAMTSDNYETNTTLGQSSPLMDSGNPPYSESYDLYPGFWYTLEAGGCENLSSFAAPYGFVNPGMPCDFDGDGDVDGSDLAEFVAGF